MIAGQRVGPPNAKAIIRHVPAYAPYAVPLGVGPPNAKAIIRHNLVESDCMGENDV